MRIGKVREAVGPEPTLLLDSGIRNGTDVVKAMACGANAVTIGRPHIYGLALAGERGVGEVLDNLLAEIDRLLHDPEEKTRYVYHRELSA